MGQTQLVRTPYTIEDVRQILDTVEKEGMSLDIENLSRKTGRSVSALRMLAYNYEVYKETPPVIKQRSARLFNLFSQYENPDKATNKIKVANQEENKIATLAKDMQDAFETLQAAVNDYIDATVEERAAQRADRTMKEFNEELIQLREYKQKVQSLR